MRGSRSAPVSKLQALDRLPCDGVPIGSIGFKTLCFLGPQ